MLNNHQNRWLLLQLFAEGVAEGTGVTASDAGMQGVNGADPTARESEPTAPDREAEFQKLIQGPYKELYDARVQDIVQKRLKAQRKTLEQYQSLAPTLDRLAEKYGVPRGDYQALEQAVAREGQPPRPTRQQQAQTQYDSWLQQAEAAKQLFPELELRQEAENPRFLQLLDQGLSVEDAYLLIHRDQIIPAAMQYSAKAVEQKLANRIAANALRPSETGMEPRGSSVTKPDVSHMSRAQRMDIIRRVQSGEVIRF